MMFIVNSPYIDQSGTWSESAYGYTSRLANGILFANLCSMPFLGQVLPWPGTSFHQLEEQEADYAK